MNQTQTQTIARWLALAVAVGGCLFIVFGLGDEHRDDSARVVGVAIAVAFFTLAGAPGASLVRRHPRLALFGILTVGIALLAFLAVTLSIWSDDPFNDNRRVAVGGTILALGMGFSSVLLGSAREGDSAIVSLVRGGTVIAIGLLALLAVIEISESGPDVERRQIATAAAVVVLGTILIPLLRVATGGSDAANARTDQSP